MKKRTREFWLGTALFVLSAQLPAHAYIDPGTGSMLFSVILGCSATLFFVISSLWIKLKQRIFTKKDLAKNNIPFVIYSEGNQYFNVFKPVLDEFETREIPVLYYTSAQDDKNFEYDYKNVKCEYIGAQNKAFFKLAFLRADICLMTIPQLDVLQLKRSKFVKHYCHIFHSITASMDYRLFSLDYYDSVLCGGEFQIPLIRELETKRNLPQKELITAGSTYMDYLETKKVEIPHPYTILIAPSWGEDGLLSKFGSQLIPQAIKTGAKVIVRPHPQSLRVEKELIEKLQKEFSDVVWDKNPDNMQTLAQADILISDFSCILFDYAFLFNKPFIYSISDMNNEIYDMSDLDEIPLRYTLIKEIGAELTKDNLNDLANIINNLNNNEQIQQNIQKAKDLTWQNRGNSAKAVVDYLVKKQKELCEC